VVGSDGKWSQFSAFRQSVLDTEELPKAPLYANLARPKAGTAASAEPLLLVQLAHD